MSRYLCLILAIFALPSSSLAAIRIWTDRQGRQISAEFVRLHEGTVVLARGKKVISVSLVELCAEDREAIRKELVKQGKEDSFPGLDLTAAPTSMPRLWTDAHGNRLTAALQGMSGNNVLLNQNGQTRSYPLTYFSSADQDYIRQQLGLAQPEPPAIVATPPERAAPTRPAQDLTGQSSPSMVPRPVSRPWVDPTTNAGPPVTPRTSPEPSETVTMSEFVESAGRHGESALGPSAGASGRSAGTSDTGNDHGRLAPENTTAGSMFPSMDPYRREGNHEFDFHTRRKVPWYEAAANEFVHSVVLGIIAMIVSGLWYGLSRGRSS